MPPCASAAAKRDRGTAAATARASAIVSTSRSGGRLAVVRPSASSRARWRAPVSGALIGTPANTAACGAAQADRPVAAVRRAPEHRVVRPQRRQAALEQRGRHLRRVHADQQRGGAGVGERGGEPLGEAGAALRQDLPAARAATAPGAPSSTSTRRSAAAARSRRRACPRARRAASRAACRGEHGGHRRVLTRPGTGAFAITSSAAAHDRTAAMSRTARAVPRTVPVTFERPARGW